jgi:general stress protein YciG
MTSKTGSKVRGFAGMDPERRRDISRKGGIAAHRKGTAHQWTPATARDAGRKGGLASRGKQAAETPEGQSETGAQPQGGAPDNTLPS